MCESDVNNNKKNKTRKKQKTMAAQEFRGRIAVRGAAPGKLRDRWLEAAFCSIAGGDLALYAVPGSRSGSSSRSRSGSSSGFGSTDSEGGALLLRVSLGSAVACLADAGSQRFKAPDKGVGGMLCFLFLFVFDF